MSKKNFISNNFNPLIEAISSENLDLIRILIRQGESSIINSFSDTTPLEYAVRKGNIIIVQELLNSDIDIRNWRVTASLCEAVSKGFIEIVKLFLDMGINVNESIDEDGHTVLMEASSEGYLEIVKLLVEKGADVDYLFEGSSAIFYAINGGHKDVCDFLFPLIKNQEILKIFHKDYSSAFNKLSSSIKQPKNSRIELFADAASEGELKLIEREIKKGIDIDALDSAGTPALMYAAVAGHLEIVEILLDSGADPNGICKPGLGQSSYSTLMALTKRQGRSFVEIMNILIQKGADVNFTDSGGNTALYNLIRFGTISNRDKIELGMKKLCSAGANVNITNHFGESILAKALEKKGFEKIGNFLEMLGAKKTSRLIL
jgi:uncharacterized protein